MPTYLLTWNPDKWPWPNLAECIENIRRQGYHTDTWSCGRNQKIIPGDQLFLLRQGREPRGLCGSGWATSAAYEDLHWDTTKRALGKLACHVEVRFDVLLDGDHEPIFPRAHLSEGVFAQVHWGTQVSGITIPPHVAAQLEVEWQQFIGKS
jgi:hypothetical protein